ncbi:protein YgfX [Paraburkholderia sp. Ac-20340]|uniref:protein YgfX n=1 Tax=Paraburkholderia sp. Ac-20340 TaxID=2703888 RepID=UPI003217F822
MRPSWTLQAVLLVGVLVAALALYSTLAPWLGAWRALPPALALAATGGLAFAAWRRAQPAFIEIGTDRFAAFSHSQACLLEGRLLGAAQWGGAMLSLSVAAGARRRSVLIAADSLDAESFRVLAVAARSASGR